VIYTLIYSDTRKCEHACHSNMRKFDEAVFKHQLHEWHLNSFAKSIQGHCGQENHHDIRVDINKSGDDYSLISRIFDLVSVKNAPHKEFEHSSSLVFEDFTLHHCFVLVRNIYQLFISSSACTSREVQVCNIGFTICHKIMFYRHGYGNKNKIITFEFLDII